MEIENGTKSSGDNLLGFSSKIDNVNVADVKTNSVTTNIVKVTDSNTTSILFQRGLTISASYSISYEWAYDKRNGTNRECLSSITFTVKNLSLSHVYFQELVFKPYVKGWDGTSVSVILNDNFLVVNAETISPSNATETKISNEFYGPSFWFEFGINIFNANNELLLNFPFGAKTKEVEQLPIPPATCTSGNYIPFCTPHNPTPVCLCQGGVVNYSCSCQGSSSNSCSCQGSSSNACSCQGGSNSCSCQGGSSNSCGNTSCWLQGVCWFKSTCQTPTCNVPKPQCGDDTCGYNGCTSQGNSNGEVLQNPSGHPLTTSCGKFKITGWEEETPGCGNWHAKEPNDDLQWAEAVECGNPAKCGGNQSSLDYPGTCKSEAANNSQTDCPTHDHEKVKKETAEKYGLCYPSGNTCSASAGNDGNRPCSTGNPKDPSCSTQQGCTSQCRSNGTSPYCSSGNSCSSGNGCRSGNNCSSNQCSSQGDTCSSSNGGCVGSNDPSNPAY